MISSLQSRYPGVEFVGEQSPATSIDDDVTIFPGARIDLSQGVQIRKQSVIGEDAIIEGGDIRSSIVHGRVSGGRIDQCTIDVFARIAGGTLRRCMIRGHAQVHHGTLLDTTVADRAHVRGGQATGCEISGHSRVTGGRLEKSIIQGAVRITGGHAVGSKLLEFSQMTGGLLVHSTVYGNVTVHGRQFHNAEIGYELASLHRASRGKELRFRKVSILGRTPPPGAALSRLLVRPSHHRPPEVIIDHATGHLIIDAVCTPEGKTHNRSTIRPRDAHVVYPNRMVQDISVQWREFVAVSGLMQMRGYTNRIPFRLPPLVDPITSQRIHNAVLCRCGQTFDRASIQDWIRQHQWCPVNSHTLHEEDLYPNRAIQRLIEERACHQAF